MGTLVTHEHLAANPINAVVLTRPDLILANNLSKVWRFFFADSY